MYTVIGINLTSFTNKEGEQVTKCTIYTTFDPARVYPKANDFIGTGCDTFVLFGDLPEFLDDLLVGDSFRPVYNKYGRFIDIIKT